MIDFLPVKSVDGRDASVPVAGGSCLNIAVGMARLGAPAGFVGGISTDLFGRMIADHALASQVDLRYATRSAHQATLAFVRTVGGEGGRPSAVRPVAGRGRVARFRRDRELSLGRREPAGPW